MQHHYEGHCKGWALKIETLLGPEMAQAKPFGPKKVEVEIGRTGYQKKRNFALISKMCRSLEFNKREKKFIFGNILTQDFYTFLKSIPLLLIPFAPNFEEIFFNSCKGQFCFFGS